MEKIIDLFNTHADLLVLTSLILSIGLFLTGLGTQDKDKVKYALQYLGSGYFIYLVSTPKSQEMVKTYLTDINMLLLALLFIGTFSLIEILIVRIKRKLRKKKEQQHINERNN